jgi:hypothetical protein
MEKRDFDLFHAHNRGFRADLFTMHSIPYETRLRGVRRRCSSAASTPMA